MEQQANPERAGTEAEWQHTAVAYLAAFAGMLALFFVMVVMIDPYDSGRFPTFMPSGSPDDRAPTMNIGRGRDPRFNAILLGSSRGVLADPRRISALTGYRFAEMAALGATPREQMIFLHWFARHRPKIDAIVIATDQVWCTLDPALPSMNDFPYGLYADSDLAYLKATLSVPTLTFAKERLLYALGLMPGVDIEGYYDSEAKLGWPGVETPRMPLRQVSGPDPPKVELPALGLLGSYLQDLPGRPPILLWMPPYFHDVLPAADTRAGRALAACKAALRDWAQRRGRAGFLDFATDAPENAAPGNFLNPTHVSNRYMRLIEPQLADALDRLK